MNSKFNKRVEEKNNIFTVFMDIISRNKSDNIKEEMLSERLEEIYRAQSELGITDSIRALERDVETHISPVKMTKKMDTSRISTKSGEYEKEKTIQENTLNQENNVER